MLIVVGRVGAGHQFGEVHRRPLSDPLRQLNRDRVDRVGRPPPDHVHPGGVGVPRPLDGHDRPLLLPDPDGGDRAVVDRHVLTGAVDDPGEPRQGLRRLRGLEVAGRVQHLRNEAGAVVTGSHHPRRTPMAAAPQVRDAVEQMRLGAHGDELDHRPGGRGDRGDADRLGERQHRLLRSGAVPSVFVDGRGGTLSDTVGHELSRAETSVALGCEAAASALASTWVLTARWPSTLASAVAVCVSRRGCPRDRVRVTALDVLERGEHPPRDRVAVPQLPVNRRPDSVGGTYGELPSASCVTSDGVKSCEDDGGAEPRLVCACLWTSGLRPPATVRCVPACVTAEPAPVTVGIVRDWTRDGALSRTAGTVSATA